MGLISYGSADSLKENIETVQIGDTVVDWRGNLDVTPIKNQTYTCNAGYAMAVSGAIEASVKKYRNQIVPLSAQQLVDCTIGYGNFGCKGGYASKTLDFIKTAGLATENDYRYTGQQGTCRTPTAYAGIKGYYSIENEVKVMTALNSQPVVLSFEYNADLQHYIGGIYKNRTTCGSNLNHYGVGVGVGYVYQNPENSYWIIKNSFGNIWGERGYLRMDMYTCGIARNGFNVGLME